MRPRTWRARGGEDAYGQRGHGLALAAIIGTESFAGLLSGAGAVVALILGLIAGGVSADTLASRRSGTGPRQDH